MTVLVFSASARNTELASKHWKLTQLNKGTTTGARLQDKKWVLEAIAGKSAGAVGENAFVSFDNKKGSAGGNTSCNAYGGEYTAKGSTISITHIISTMRACIEDDSMNIESLLLTGLNDADRFEIKDGKLYLYKGKELLLTFRGENKTAH